MHNVLIGFGVGMESFVFKFFALSTIIVSVGIGVVYWGLHRSHRGH